MNLDDVLCSKLEEIANVLVNSFNRYDNNGILAGYSGLALFMFYYSRFSNDSEYLKYGNLSLEKAVDIINEANFKPTYCSGISGLGWTCYHLSKCNFINLNDVKFLKEIDEYLMCCMRNCFLENNYDFLHGGLGIGYYFINKKDKAGIDLLLELINKLSMQQDDGSLFWRSMIEFPTREMGVNISLSHGITGIVACLLKLLTIDEYANDVKEIITKSINYILSQQNRENRISYFPTYSQGNARNTMWSRLGWCYGDLGIAFTIYRISKIFERRDLEKFSLEVLQHSSKRLDMKKNAVFDAGICHGSAGIAHIYRRIYCQTKSIDFYKSSEYWFKKTIEFARHDSAPAGYKKWIKDDILCEDYSLLNGLIGIGLCIISKLNPDLSDWDECILLS